MFTGIPLTVWVARVVGVFPPLLGVQTLPLVAAHCLTLALWGPILFIILAAQQERYPHLLALLSEG